MLSFLRKIRKSTIHSGAARKYALYAFGEITLVVLGILIALQINNWNEQRILTDRETNLLYELRTNLETNVINLQSDVNHQQQQMRQLKRIIIHLEQKRDFKDSLSHWLDFSMPAPDVILTSAAFETLKSTGLELIRSDSLRKDIINLFEVHYPFLIQETKRLEDQMWPSVVLPMQQKYFKITPNDRYVPTNYEALLKDAEFTNMLSFRWTMRNYSTHLKVSAIDYTRDVIASINRDLKFR